MIVGSLYPVDDTIYVGNDPNLLAATTTTYWGRASGGITINSPESYWLGYINKENLPGMYHTNIMYLDDDDPNNQKIVIKDLTDADNFPCTYMQRSGADYSSNLYAESFHMEYDGVISDLVGSPYRRYFFNQNYVEYSGLLYNNSSYQSSRTCSIAALCYIFDYTGDNRLFPVNVPIGNELFRNIFYASGSTYIDDLYKFLYLDEEYTFNITFYDSGVSYSYDFPITADDLADGTGIIWDTNNQVQLRFFIVSFDFGTGGALRNGSAIVLGPSFMAKVTGHDAEHAISVLRDGHGSYGYGEKINYANNFYWGTPARYENPLFVYGYKDDTEFDKNAVHNLNDRDDVPYIYTDAAVCFAYDGGAWFLPYYNLDDVKKSFSLFYRVCRSNVNSYVSGVSYATDVTPDNQFLAQLKTGNISDPTFKNSLREWQYDAFTDNDFTEDDVPHPSPGPGPRPDPVDPGDQETDGDDADMNDPTGIGNGFEFTTMYGIRASHLTEIGHKLWTGFTDVTDYINNFIFAVDPTTGSVNMADIMQFFISLRAYPCPLSAMASTSAGGTDLYIGSGAAPLSLSTPFSIVDSYIGHIDAGEVSIPYWYGDYRDFALEIICYLPYCGTVQLNAGDVMGGTLCAYYTVDFCSGACMAYVLCTTWEDKTIIVGSLPGQLGADIPLTATNAGQVMARMYGDRINVAETLLGAAKNAATGIGAIMSGNFAGAIRSGIGAFIDPAIANERQLAEMGSRGAIAAPMLSGGRGLAAFGTSRTAYVQIRSPYYTEPSNYEHSVGTPAASAVRIGDCTGFCQFVNVDVSGITADADDQNAIRAALESGVII